MLYMYLIFDQSTVAACKCYCPQRKDMQSFVIMINKWWTIVNSKTRFSANPLASAIAKMMEKWSFYNRLLTGFPAGVKPEVDYAYHSKRFKLWC